MDSRPTENSPGIFSRCFDSLSQLAAAVIVAAALFLAGKYYLVDRIDEEIRGRVESKLAEHYPGLSVSVSSARRLEGEGIEVRGLMIREGGGRNAPVVLSVEHLFVACETKLPDMVTQPLQFRRAEVRGVRVRAERKASGVWSVQHLLPIPKNTGASFPISVDDMVVEIIDPLRSPQAGLTLREIHLSLTPQANDDQSTAQKSTSRIALRGRGTGDHFEKVDFQGVFDRDTSEWSLTGAVEGLEFTQRLRAALPSDCDRWIAPLASVRGRTQFGFRIQRLAQNGKLNQPQWDFQIVGDVSEGRIDDDRLPEPLNDVSAHVEVDPSGLRIENLSGRCGPAEVWANLRTHGFTAQSPVELELNLEGWPIERLLATLLAKSASEELRKLSLQGVADVAGRFSYDGKAWTHQAEAKLRQVNLLYDSFRYPLSDGEGRLIGHGDRIRTELQLFAGSEPVSIVGEVPAAGRPGMSWVEIRTLRPVPIDERLIAACDKNTQQVVRSFRPRGSISFAGRMEKSGPNEPISKMWRIDLHELSIRSDQFAYPIDQVRGVLAYENGNWNFLNLSGRNGSGYITGEGVFTHREQAPGLVDLHFAATDVALDEDLRNAINATGQHLWGQLRPRGTLDQLDVNLAFEVGRPETISITMHGQKFQAQQNVDGRTISLEPQLMPYRLDNVTGEFNYHNGIVELKNLQASHGRAIFSLEGDFRPNDRGGWLLRFTRLAVDRLNIDRELWEAMPPDWSASAGRVRLEGPVGVLGTLSINLNDEIAPPAERFLVDWDLQLDLEDGRFDPGTRLEHVYGGVRLVGRGGPTGFASRGELLIDSFVAQGVQFAQVRGPFALDSRRLLVGEWSEANIRTRPPRPVTAKVFGGQAVLNASLDFNQEGTFAVQTALDEANLWNITLETMPERAGMSGKAYGTLSLQGSLQGMHTWRGNGAIRLRDANIYEVPVFLAVLRLLSVTRQDNLVFRESNMDFRVVGDDLQFDRLDFHSELVSLKGRGQMAMTDQRPVDLQFYTQVGRDELQVPILRPLLGEASRSFLLIEVAGPAESPQVTKKAFPAINDQLRQLFPDLAEGPRPDDPVSRPSLLRRR